LTSTGCGFVSTDGLDKCLASCDVVIDIPNPCPLNVQQVQCLVDPCKEKTCDANPSAKCHASYCGDCRAVWTDDSGAEVQCDSGCTSLGCDGCLKNPKCEFCSGAYTASGTAGVDGQSFGFCVGIETASSQRCVASNSAQLIGNGGTCPTPTTTTDPKIDTSAGDAGSIQEASASSTGHDSFRQRFIMLITLVVNNTNNNQGGWNIVTIFVDLIGQDTPTATDKEEICSILKDAIKKVDTRAQKALSIVCDVNEKTSRKRDTSYVAALSFPGDTNAQTTASASQALFSASAALLALIAIFF